MLKDTTAEFLLVSLIDERDTIRDNLSKVYSALADMINNPEWEDYPKREVYKVLVK